MKLSPFESKHRLYEAMDDDREIIGVAASNMSFNGTTLERIHFIEVDFKNCDFDDATLIECDFTKCTFTNCNSDTVVFKKCYINGRFINDEY